MIDDSCEFMGDSNIGLCVGKSSFDAPIAFTQKGSFTGEAVCG
jgi:hypothetical protein